MAGMADTYIKETEEHLVHTYNRFPVVLERGEGVFLYDTEGRRYLDFAAGIAVCSLGYGNKELQDAMKQQIDLLMHTSNLYYNTACGAEAHYRNGQGVLYEQRHGSDRRRVKGGKKIRLPERDGQIRVYCNGTFFPRS